MTARPRILCVSFSPIHADSRVLRQIEVLREHGDVTTVGYGEAPHGVARHIQVPDSAASLPQTPLGILRLALRLHRTVELTAPGEKAVLPDVLGAGRFDLVVANDGRALPLAFAAAQGAPVYADMHEWAPEERATIFSWRVLVGPYMAHLCRSYLPRAAAITSVSFGLTKLYADTFGVEAETVRNAAWWRDLTPTPVNPDRIRIVHSGTADPERNIMELIDAVDELGERYSLDLYLLGDPNGYLAEIRARAATSAQVTVHDAIPPAELPSTLNQYDIGVFLYPLLTKSHLYHLPNKFFDFVQARLALVFSPAPEINDYFERYGVGRITGGTSAHALVETLRSLSADQIAALKDASHASSRELAGEVDHGIQTQLVGRVLAGRV
jgi:glycosyltransferase involved in cell wall biosynthesis